MPNPEKTRRCPACGTESTERLCPKDGVPMLVPGPPRMDAYDLPKGMLISERYRIERRIGAGAFGTVFAASHLLTGQPIALKVLSTGMGEDDSGIVRFFHEARVTARLSHPNTIRVFDFGQDDSGLIYLAMEFLSGKTLRDLLNERRDGGVFFSEAEVTEIALAVTRSLSEAHGHRLVHRDLKPENIMMQEVVGNAPQLKVLDFGIVKQSTMALTAVGQTPGTPAYSSPEQICAQALDGRSDLYSLGVMMFELLTGIFPFVAPNHIAAMHLKLISVAPDVRTKSSAPISEAMATLIARSLSRLPDDRYIDAAQMRTALEASRRGVVDEARTTESISAFEESSFTAPSIDPANMDKTAAMLLALSDGIPQRVSIAPDTVPMRSKIVADPSNVAALPSPAPASRAGLWIVAALALGIIGAGLWKGSASVAVEPLAERAPAAPLPVVVVPVVPALAPVSASPVLEVRPGPRKPKPKAATKAVSPLDQEVEGP